jgi:hypothetical protein
MPNVSRVFGLRPVKHLGAAAYNGAVETFAILAADGTATFNGDAVKSSGTADANGVQAVIRMAANTDLPTGVVVGFQPDYSNLYNPGQYRLASTARYAFVAVDPTIVYEVQANAATALADIGLNVGIAYTAGSTATGQSGMQADMATKATTNTLPLKIVGVVQRPDQDMSDSTNWKLLVTLNTANFGNGPGSAGS